MDDKKRKIAIYGLGTETERVIPQLQEKYIIAGLLDGFKTSGVLFGEKIISLDQAIKSGVERIIVVARPGSCKAIEKRIGEQCRENEIELYDIRGKNLLVQNKETYSTRQILDVVMQESDRHLYSDEVKTRLFCDRMKSITDRKENVVIKDAFDIGYLFCAPMITDFVLWLYRKIKEESIQNIWFSARDGYLIKKLFSVLDSSLQTTYFLTSRMAAIRAGVCNDNDLLYVDSMKFSGTISENLKTRFGIQVDDREHKGKKILDYREEILEKTEKSREGYRRYIETLNLKSGEIAMFDFVAKGTSQYFLGKLVPNHIRGFYFLQLEPDFMRDKDLDIEPFYTDEELNTSAIFENYYILETILTSPDPSSIDFTENGTPIYAKETRKQQDIHCFLEVQEGIISYFKDFIHSCPFEKSICDKKYDEVFLKLIHNVELQNRAFKDLTVEDPFFNRMTAITDVL